MKKLAMKMLSLLLVLSLLLPTCVFAQPGQDGDGTPGTQSTTSEKTTTFTEGGNGDEDADAPTGGGSGDEDADAPTGGGNGDGDAGAPTGGGNSDEDADVSAEEAAPTVVEMEEVVLDLSDMDLPDNDELFAAYVEREFDRAAGGMQYPVFYSSSHATRPLTDTERRIYNALKTEIEKIANGTVHDTQINVTITWTAAELGGTDFSDATTRSRFTAAAGDWDITNVSKALLADCAYELYWYDKTQGVSVPGYTIAPPASGGTATQSYTVKFYVAKAYSAANAVKTYVTRSDLSAVNAAVSKAGNIVTTYAGKSDDEKLDGYFAEIRTLVDYNYDALAAGTLYGDPWQMIYVFDNDPTTKVVCEGYAKAFQYLCEKSSPQIKCYNVTGKMNGGDHMWNVVEQGGTRYLVDVTNCDDGEKDGSTLYGYGYMANPRDCYLYMKTGSPSTDGKTHTFTFHNTFLNNDYTVEYVYGESMKDLFCEGYPKLGTEVKHTVTIANTTNMTVTSGSLTQEVLNTAPMTEVILTAANGYYFPVGYSVSGGSGVTVTRLDYRQIKVSGTPTANATISLTAPTAKTNATLTTNPMGKTGLKYNGNAQELVAAGSGVTGGTLQYSLSSGTGFSTAIPKGTNAGSYTVYYKVVGDDMHNDTTEQTINVSIGQKTPEVSDFVFAAPSSLGYDGNNKEASVTLKSLYSDAGGSITIEYKKSGTAVTKPKDVGEYTVSIDYKGGTNFVSKSGLNDGAWKFTIVPGDIPAEVVNGVTGYSGTYDGNPHDAVIVNPTATGGYTLEYKGSGSTTYSGTMPKVTDVADSGDVWVKLSKTNYADKVIKVTAKVSPKPLTNDMINLGTQKTYDGSPHGPVYSVKDGGTVLNKGTDYNETSGFNPLINVVNMTLGISGVGNYKGEASAVWSLQRATPTAGDFDIPGLGTGYDYNGNPWSVNAPTLKSPKTGAGEVTVYYEGTSGTTYPESTAAPTDVGSYSVTFNVAEGQNFNAASGLSIDTLKINKVNYTPPAVSGTVRSNQVTTNKTLELPALPAGASYTASGTVGGTAGLISSHSVSGTTLTYSTTNQMDGISATITIPVTGATNYNNYYVVVTVIAKDKDDAGVSITNGSSASVTYGETITISATTTASENGTWTWNYDTTVFDVVGASNESTITLKAKAATTTAVTVKATFESPNYMGDASISVNVNKATPVAGNFMFTAPTVLVYDGSNKMATVTEKSGIAGMGAVTVKYFKDDSPTTDTKAAGTYVVKVDVAAGANYAAISDLTADGWTFTVMRANASVTAAPAAVGSLGYDGSAKNLITAGTCTGGTMKYRLGDSGAWGAAIPQATNAGTYTVWYKVVGDGNHNDTAAASVTVTIARQNITPSVTVSGSYTYNNGNPIIPTVEVKNGGATLTAGTDYDVLVSDNTNAGTGKVTVKERADSNYTFTEVHKTFSIGMANQATLTVTGGTSVVYGETLTLGTSGGSGTGAVTYTVTDVTGKATITGNVLTPTQAGTVKVKATKAADTNHNAIDSAEVEITITQATPTGAPKFTKITSSGKTLGDAALVKTVSGSGDGFSVAGTVEWVDGSGTALADSTSVEANKSYGWKFTPADSNYKSISGSVVVYTVRRVSHSGGAAADSAAAAAQPTVYSGSRGESVKTLQERLNAKGYNAGSVDGIFGKNTQAAVMAFQKANGLAADGIVGKLTWAKLYDTTAALPAASTATGTQPMVYRGSRGDAVRRLQELLNKKGFDCGAVDGIFGSKTYAAVVAFQKANGLGADGIVGPLTWGKLG